MKYFKKYLAVFFCCIGFFFFVGLICALAINKDKSTYDDLTITHREETHAESVSGLTIYAGELLTAKTEDTDKLSVKITAIELENDIVFAINGKIYTWNDDVAGTDVTDAFGVEVNQDEKTLTIGATLEEMLNAYAESIGGAGAKIVYGTLPTSDMFRLTVAVGEQSIDVDFSSVAQATGITLDTDRIVFEP